MKDFSFYENYIIYVFIIIMVLVLVLVFIAIFNNNRSINTNDTRFTWVIIRLGNGELIEGEITSWRDFNDSDMIQVIIDGNLTVLTHSSNVLLFNHNP